MLSFFGIAPGQRVAELVAGDGYTAELLGRVVGEKGEVWANNPRSVLDAFAAGPWGQRLSKAVMSNVRNVERDLESPLPPEAHDLDVVLFVLVHDTLGQKTDRAKMDKAVFDALKPGGVYGVVDQGGRAGSGTNEAQAKAVTDEATKAGFKLAGEADFLRNPSRFVLKFVKP
jgi:predicted methyltransferase